MTISWLQAIILGIFACLSSMPGMGGTTISVILYAKVRI